MFELAALYKGIFFNNALSPALANFSQYLVT